MKDWLCWSRRRAVATHARCPASRLSHARTPSGAAIRSPRPRGGGGGREFAVMPRRLRDVVGERRRAQQVPGGSVYTFVDSPIEALGKHRPPPATRTSTTSAPISASNCCVPVASTRFTCISCLCFSAPVRGCSRILARTMCGYRSSEWARGQRQRPCVTRSCQALRSSTVPIGAKAHGDQGDRHHTLRHSQAGQQRVPGFRALHDAKLGIGGDARLKYAAAATEPLLTTAHRNTDFVHASMKHTTQQSESMKGKVPRWER
jgi:hypothetical protein